MSNRPSPVRLVGPSGARPQPQPAPPAPQEAAVTESNVSVPAELLAELGSLYLENKMLRRALEGVSAQHQALLHRIAGTEHEVRPADSEGFVAT